MKFCEAFEMMKQGVFVKLPSWGGYWCWNSEKETIEMHCREKDSDTGKDVLDIRETQRVEYTLNNIMSDEWIIATKENTPILGGVARMNFKEAFKYLERGLTMSRVSWNNSRSIKFEKDKNTGKSNVVVNILSNSEINCIASYGFIPEDLKAEDWIFAE